MVAVLGAADAGAAVAPGRASRPTPSTAVVAFAIQRPTLRRLVRREGIESDADREAWRARARRQRYIAYGITTAVGVIAFLMSTKPVLW